MTIVHVAAKAISIFVHLATTAMGRLRRGTWDQACLVGFQVKLHSLKGAHLSSPHLSLLPEHAVSDQNLSNVNDLNIGILHLPKLSFRQ